MLSHKILELKFPHGQCRLFNKMSSRDAPLLSRQVSHCKIPMQFRQERLDTLTTFTRFTVELCRLVDLNSRQPHVDFRSGNLLGRQGVGHSRSLIEAIASVSGLESFQQIAEKQRRFPTVSHSSNHDRPRIYEPKLRNQMLQGYSYASIGLVLLGSQRQAHR